MPEVSDLGQAAPVPAATAATAAAGAKPWCNSEHAI